MPQHRDPEIQEWLSLRDAAAYIGISLSSLRTLIKQKRLQSYHLAWSPRSIRIKKADMDSLMEPEK
jgi:excisionase family DNA binding protein